MEKQHACLTLSGPKNILPTLPTVSQQRHLAFPRVNPWVLKRFQHGTHRKFSVFLGPKLTKHTTIRNIGTFHCPYAH
jgi:hypothetical protein